MKMMGFANAKKTPLVKPTHCSPGSSVNLVTDVWQMKRAQPTRFDQSLRLLPLDRDIFNQAAHLVRNSKNGLRAADALHLALALRVGAAAFFTLYLRLAESAKHSKLLSVDF
jgi:predicted nucleic acid-binding protein